MADFKGGRGKKVSYETQMYRIPTPLRPTVESLGLQFRLLWDGLVDPTGQKLISRIEAAIPDPEQLANGNGHNLISGKAVVAIPDIKYRDQDDAEADEDDADEDSDPTNEQTIREQAAKIRDYVTQIKFLDKELAAAREHGKRSGLERELQIALDAAQKMETGWERDRQALKEREEDKKQLQSENERLLADQARADAAIKELSDQLDSKQSQLEDQAMKAEQWYTKAKAAEEEIERLRSQLQPQPAAAPEAIPLLQEALLLKANAGGKIKDKIREALALLGSSEIL